MTISEVRGVLGSPQAVSRRENRGFGFRYIEYQWDYGAWRVGFGGQAGREQAVRIGTTLRGQRTRLGIGVGSNTRAIARRYGRGILCVERDRLKPDPGTWLVVRGPGARMTAFALVKANGRGYAPRVPPAVAEVIVQFAWSTGGTTHCRIDWRTYRW